MADDLAGRSLRFGAMGSAGGAARPSLTKAAGAAVASARTLGVQAERVYPPRNLAIADGALSYPPGNLQAVTTSDPLTALANLLVPLLQAAVPERAGGYGGSLQVYLGQLNAVDQGLDPDVVRTALRRAAKSLDWEVETHLYPDLCLTVRDTRIPPPPYDEAVDADMARRKRETTQFVSAFTKAQRSGEAAPTAPEPNPVTSTDDLERIVDDWFTIHGA